MKYSLTAIGLDRHGIVKDVTKILFDNDCNLEDSSMTILESNFAIILIMKPSKSSDISKIKKDIEELERTSGLKIQLKELEETEPTVEKGSHIVTVYGGDKSGIVYKTASLLAEKNVNITDLETKIIETEKNKDI